MDWLNEPTTWSAQDDRITIQAGPGTDFWRRTHNGEIRDNGHLYFQQVEGDFVAEVQVAGAYATRYDQAGLMARVDEENWIKCGIEFVDGVQYASAVITRQYSDWSVLPLIPAPHALCLRLTRHNSTVEVHYSRDGARYDLLRRATLARQPACASACSAPRPKVPASPPPSAASPSAPSWTRPHDTRSP